MFLTSQLYLKDLLKNKFVKKTCKNFVNNHSNHQKLTHSRERIKNKHLLQLPI